MGSPVMRYPGLIRYSLHMCRALVERVFKVAAPAEKFVVSSLLVFTAHIFAPVLCAALLYRFIEEPARKLIQVRFANPHPKPWSLADF